MKQNVRCTIEDVLNLLKEKYRKEGEQAIPDFALENGMDGSVLPEILQDVIINVLEQKKDATNDELLKALNYYMERDTFLSF